MQNNHVVLNQCSLTMLPTSKGTRFGQNSRIFPDFRWIAVHRPESVFIPPNRQILLVHSSSHNGRRSESIRRCYAVLRSQSLSSGATRTNEPSSDHLTLIAAASGVAHSANDRKDDQAEFRVLKFHSRTHMAQLRSAERKSPDAKSARSARRLCSIPDCRTIRCDGRNRAPVRRAAGCARHVET